jgi:hypothetical protein
MPIIVTNETVIIDNSIDGSKIAADNILFLSKDHEAFFIKDSVLTANKELKINNVSITLPLFQEYLEDIGFEINSVDTEVTLRCKQGMYITKDEVNWILSMIQQSLQPARQVCTKGPNVRKAWNNITNNGALLIGNPIVLEAGNNFNFRSTILRSKNGSITLNGLEITNEKLQHYLLTQGVNFNYLGLEDGAALVVRFPDKNITLTSQQIEEFKSSQNSSLATLNQLLEQPSEAPLEAPELTHNEGYHPLLTCSSLVTPPSDSIPGPKETKSDSSIFPAI